MSDKNRRTLFVELMTGERDFERMVKKTRIIRVVAERALRDLEGQGLVERKDADLALTPTGEEVARELKRRDLLS